MLAHALQRLAPQCATLILSANGDPRRFSAFGLAVVADDPPDFSGPLAGILAGMDYCARRAAQCAYVASLPADTPFPPGDFVARLAWAAAEGADIAVAASGGRQHHAAALWPVALASDLRRALSDGIRKVAQFSQAYRVATVEWPATPFDPFFNVNTPEDLRSAEAALASGGF